MQRFGVQDIALSAATTTTTTPTTLQPYGDASLHRCRNHAEKAARQNSLDRKPEPQASLPVQIWAIQQRRSEWLQSSCFELNVLTQSRPTCPDIHPCPLACALCWVRSQLLPFVIFRIQYNVPGPLHRPRFQMRAPISFSGLICSVSQLLMRELPCTGNLCRDSHSHATAYGAKRVQSPTAGCARDV